MKVEGMEKGIFSEFAFYQYFPLVCLRVVVADG